MKKKKILSFFAVGLAILFLVKTSPVLADNNAQSQVVNNSQQTDQSSSDDNSRQKQTAWTDENQKPKTSAVSGWAKQKSKVYYYVNNKPITGYHKISKDWYLFDKHGVMKTGVQNVSKKRDYAYFDQNGKQRKKNTKTRKAYYWINKSGKITGIKNNAKVICQRPQMPTGCEITAVTMMVNFAGKKVTKYQAAKVMHYSKNPNKGFIGSPYKKWPLGYWVAPNGIKSVVKHYLGKSQVMTKASMSAIKNKLLHSHLVVAWVGMFDGISNHAIALTGYHNGRIYYNDPWTGTKRSISEKRFKLHWKLDAYRALSY